MHDAHLGSQAEHTGVVRMLLKYRPDAQAEHAVGPGPVQLEHVASHDTHDRAEDGSASYRPAGHAHTLPVRDAEATHDVHAAADPEQAAQAALHMAHATPEPPSVS